MSLFPLIEPSNFAKRHACLCFTYTYYVLVDTRTFHYNTARAGTPRRKRKWQIKKVSIEVLRRILVYFVI